MIIDVDIGISNDEGIPLKRFHKRFDERFDRSSCIENSRIQNDFEDFLNQYLSVSGRTMRNQLMIEGSTDCYSNDLYDSFRSDLSYNPFFVDTSSDALEYIIRIGEGKSIAGKIPLNHILKIKNLTDKLEQMQMQERTVIQGKVQEKVQKQIQLQQPAEQINTMFRTLIMKAVESYEMNFYHESVEQDYISSS